MKLKALAIVLSVLILLSAAVFVVTELKDFFPLEESTRQSEVSTDGFFDVPDMYDEPHTFPVSGAVATEFEPVYPISISDESICDSITLHHLVPEECREIYYHVLSALKNYEKDIKLSSPVDEDTFSRSLIYIRDLNPELFFIDWSQYNYKSNSVNKVVEVNFKFLYEDIESKMSAFESKVERIVDEANEYPNLFERELFIHDYLINNTAYIIDDGDSGNAYGAIINGQARCEGYARAFQLLMLRIGVPTFSVIGTAEGERHMWNSVELYGKYYFIDVTFDDNSAEKQVTAYSENEISHSCFNIPEEIISKTHSISKSGSKDKYGAYQNLILNKCDSYDYNYYRIRGLMAENDEQFKYILEKNSSEQRACVFFKGEMPSQDRLQQDFKNFFYNTYRSGGYSITYTPSSSSVFKRNVYEISWTIE